MVSSEIQLDGFKWTDQVNPTKQMLNDAATDLALSPRILHNCLHSDYLPHIESYGQTHFVLLRIMEPNTQPNAGSVQELTTKVALFISNDRLYSIHRLPLKELDTIADKVKDPARAPISKQKLISYFFEEVVVAFDAPLSELESKLDSFEEKLFSKRKPKNFLQEGFYLKRKASALRKVIRLTLDLLNKLSTKLDCTGEKFQQSRERLERNLFYAEDVVDNIQSLMSLHLSIESQRTNEASYRTGDIMRVLTVLTIFFLPLNFIAGVFGMNFSKIPFLEHEMGFWLSIILMFMISAVLAIYLLKQGWLSKPDISLEKNNGAD